MKTTRPRTSPGADELWAMRRRAWRESGVAVVRPDEIADAFARQALIDAARALFEEPPSQVVLRTDESADPFAQPAPIDAAQALFGERPLQFDRREQP